MTLIEAFALLKKRIYLCLALSLVVAAASYFYAVNRQVQYAYVTVIDGGWIFDPVNNETLPLMETSELVSVLETQFRGRGSRPGQFLQGIRRHPMARPINNIPISPVEIRTVGLTPEMAKSEADYIMTEIGKIVKERYSTAKAAEEEFRQELKNKIEINESLTSIYEKASRSLNKSEFWASQALRTSAEKELKELKAKEYRLRLGSALERTKEYFVTYQYDEGKIGAGIWEFAISGFLASFALSFFALILLGLGREQNPKAATISH